jgi:hypothetical protein
MKKFSPRKEGLLALSLIAFGVIGLPCLIYFVGLKVIGDYEGSNGLVSLFADIFGALGRGQIATWILVLSPYLCVQLLRITAAIRRFGKPVNPVTD